ncbi:MAG: beta-galactosidase [Bacteroidetes bacterium]|nr:beta-galactosidase [Bacteroidota bacterium]
MANKSLVKATILLSIFIALPFLTTWAQQKMNFTAGKQTFLLNDKPFLVKAAEIHYPRIPRDYWDQRIKMCKALGMNTLCIYVFWNIHEPEPGKFDFTGNNDIAAFCRLAQENGMYIILRPGPYVCAEWEMGGLPWWLLKKKDIRLREQDPYFMERVQLFEREVGKQLAPLTIQNGGPIIMVQVENEYGSYGVDKPYIAAIRNIVKESGFNDVELFQCDWSSNFTENALPDLLWTVNFGTGANIDQQFSKLKELRPDSPLMCSEYWSGWFDKWGDKHETRNADEMVAGLKEMIEKNISFSLYMTHGGTSFGHWVGADSPGYSPRCSSYDYDAPISEAGQTTPKFWALRNMMARYHNGKLPTVPKEYPVMSIPAFRFTQTAPLFDNLPKAITSYDIHSMEYFNQGYGSILYRTTLPETEVSSILRITEAHDWAQIFIDGVFITTLDRRYGEKEVTLPPLRKDARLDILVESMGRINYGRTINDYKGITESVELLTEKQNYTFSCNLKNWQVYCLEDSYAFAASRNYVPLSSAASPGYYRSTFWLKKTADTFLNLEQFGKGQVYVNGHAIGRFWHIGPQQTLYMPGCWLKKGENEIIVLDVKGPSQPIIEGLAKPILDKLNNPQPKIHRKEGQQLNLNNETPLSEGSFSMGNGWQEIRFKSPINGRYFCLRAINGYKGNEAAIAELDILGTNGLPVNREQWHILYASSEETHRGNRTADKIFDHQESTFWQSATGISYPHEIIIDMGTSNEIIGFRYLPRMEQNIPGNIKDYQIFIKENAFILN